MVSSRNLNKYQKILSNAYGMSKDSKEFIAGVRSACTFLHGAIDSQFLAENKCSMRGIQIYQEFDYKGSKLWFRAGYCHGNLTLRDPHRTEVFPFDWKTESEFIKVVLADEQLSANLQPRAVYFSQTFMVRNRNGF